jgi:diacylglycerol kinase
MDLHEKQFSLVKRAESFTHAWRGLGIFLRSTHNAWIHVAVFIGAVALGMYFSISRTEWMFLFLAAGFVFVSEAFNTAIEIDIDLTSPGHHPFAKDTKDVAAGAVLLSSMTAFIVGLFIFVPYIVR